MKKNCGSVVVYNDILFLLSQTFMYEQVKVLAEQYDVHLLAKRFENPHSFNIDEYQQIKIDQPVHIADKVVSKLARRYYDSNLYFDTRTLLRLRKFLRKEKIKAIHAHFGPRALEILGIAKKHNIPLVVTFHGYDASSLLRDDAYAQKLPYLFEYATKIIVVSEHMINTLKLDKWKQKVHIIPCSVNADEFSADGKAKSDNKIKILHAGRIVAKKGVPDLIRVFHHLTGKIQNIELHLAGDGEELDECKELVKRFSIEEKVVFYGGVSHQKIKNLLNETDIFVLNSRTDEAGDMEGTPVTILEAMCMEKAVVSTRHAGIPYVIEDGENGLLADERDNNGLGRCLQKLIQNNELRIKMGRSARATVIESFSSKVMGQKLSEVFESI
ncbi:glycosyltransferase [Rhodohalobacter sp. SW132]|uniref:glycosyltransferase family 4 protein n=1 Tax=Rhodohalobacter sp. SW132 TaxID=2293433 RepID=UPI000E229895|nr:glycosyltransferase family 4 protein [Rhodohalobacter sp. SW132]REL24197.1 glycosyltransferase [Rhodohalobacter sp. SW132]